MNRPRITSPLLICGFRPFFVLTAASAIGFMLTWVLLLDGWLDGWHPPGGPTAWHAHELLFGFAAAAVAGFALTAVPEFTATPAIGGRPLARLVLLWLLARLAYALAAYWPASLGAWPAALCNLAFWLALLRQIGPSLWRDPGRSHLSFAWAIAALCALQAGFFISLVISANAMTWLHAATGALAILIVIATSRISMSAVNGQLEQGRPGAPPATTTYLARPPRRYLAIFCIAVCSATEFALGHDIVTGWTALAAAAAMFNLLNDWHVGRPLFTRWSLMLYASYWLIALGYGLLGAAWLGAPLTSSAGRHLLTAGAMALSIFAVMVMVGRIHAGLWLDYRPWLPFTATTLVLAALLRTWAGVWAAAPWQGTLLTVSGLLWVSAFAIYLGHAWPGLSGPRTDGQEGCAEPLGRGTGSGEGGAC